MEVSKSFTVDVYGEGQDKKYRQGYSEIFEGKKKKVKKVVKRTAREVIKDELGRMWLDYINGKSSEDSFFEDIVTYVLSEKFSKVLREVKK